MKYVITREINGKEYFLDDIEGHRVTWTSNKERATTFDSEKEVNDFITSEFPGKGYYVTKHKDKDDWGIIVKPTGVWY